MIWLAWERVYFRLKIFLFRKSILWNVIKKEESVLTEQTIENKKNLPSSARRSYWRPVLPLAHHSTAQHRWELQCLFMGVMVKGLTKKQSHPCQREWLMRKRRLLLLAVKWIQKKDICLRLPWLAVEALTRIPSGESIWGSRSKKGRLLKNQWS